MDESTTKEKVLKLVRNALISKTESPYPGLDMNAPVYEPLTDLLDIVFAEEFTKAGGQFVYCSNMDEFASSLSLLVQVNTLKPLYCGNERLNEILSKAGLTPENNPGKFKNIRASITPCEFLIARLGSIMVSSYSGPGRKLNIFPEIHIVVAHASQLMPDLKHAFAAMKEKYPAGLPSMISVITGPSRTADIEKTLVMGAHGPKELYVFLIDDHNNL